jgi:hypothetical protein
MSHERFKSCIEACYDCASACDHCVNACPQEDDVKMMAKCIQLDRYYADICQLSATFMARSDGFGGENYARKLCGLCAQIFEDCGDECAKHEADHCQKCADECRKMAA